MLEADFTALDVSISHTITALRSPALTKEMLFFTMLGSPMSLTVLMLVTILVLMKKHRKEAFIFCITLLMGSVLSIILKQTIQRPRPQLSPLITEHMYSFPSAHAMNSFIFLALISYFSFHFFRNKTVTFLIVILSTLLVLLIGLSRIYLGVHYFTDVVAGYIAGFWWFVTVLLIDRTFIFYKIFKKSEA
jgi:undecaprenyl-diphosphatase